MNDPSCCPKCGFSLSESQADECGRCGLVFEKYRLRQEIPNGSSSQPAGDVRIAEEGLQDLLFASTGTTHPFFLWFRAAFLAVLAVWGGRLIFAGVTSNAAGESLLHLVNLPFHEAGHLLFRPFGEFFASLGGTLGQLLIPVICLLVLLLKTRDSFGAAVCLWWLGENFLDIAPYINDARAGELPLLGGNFGHSSPYGFHDWEFILTETGLLRHDHHIALAAHLCGALLMAVALIWGGSILFRNFRS